MTDDQTGALEITQRIEASPEIVFKYLTDPARFTRWMGVGAELDPRPGGRYRIEVDGTHFASGEYREIEAPNRLVLTWGWEGHPTVAPGSTTVEITLTAERGGTVLRLRHLGLPNQHERQIHRDGWNQYLNLLARTASP
jgi:uncharacterized protein YndB with AHSA1/START domain